MSPTLDDGEYGCFFCYFFHYELKRKQIVAVDHPHFGRIVKRISFLDSQGYYWLLGDNPNSLSSDKMGPISPQRIKSILLFKIAK